MLVQGPPTRRRSGHMSPAPGMPATRRSACVPLPSRSPSPPIYGTIIARAQGFEPRFHRFKDGGPTVRRRPWVNVTWILLDGNEWREPGALVLVKPQRQQRVARRKLRHLAAALSAVPGVVRTFPRGDIPSVAHTENGHGTFLVRAGVATVTNKYLHNVFLLDRGGDGARVISVVGNLDDFHREQQLFLIRDCVHLLSPSYIQNRYYFASCRAASCERSALITACLSVSSSDSSRFCLILSRTSWSTVLPMT